MIYIADTANINEIRELFMYFPMDGVTTNPTILANSKKPLSIVIPEILEIIGDKMMHIQTISSNASDILKEALYYKDHFQLGENYYVKIPVTKEGIRAMKMVKDAGLNITATAIFTQQQALLAAKSGADFVAPYINRLDNISSHGVEVVYDIVNTFNIHNIKCKVLGASFKNVDQVYRASVGGCHAITASYDILQALLKHPMTDIGVEAFTKDGKGVYDIDFK